MALIKVTFKHPTDGGRKTVELDDSFEAKNILNMLIEYGFIPPAEQNSSYFLLHKKTSTQLRGDDTLAGSGVEDGDEMGINPEADAGS